MGMINRQQNEGSSLPRLTAAFDRTARKRAVEPPFRERVTFGSASAVFAFAGREWRSPGRAKCNQLINPADNFPRLVVSIHSLFREDMLNSVIQSEPPGLTVGATLRQVIERARQQACLTRPEKAGALIDD